jgi:AcrR family transcriptional regulator
VSPRGYQLGRRQGDLDRTRAAILSAARQLVTEFGPGCSVGRVADRAGVSRITVYNQFRSKTGLLEALSAGVRAAHGAPAAKSDSDPAGELRRRFELACAAWATDPGLHRQLQGRFPERDEASESGRGIAERLAARDQLRPGCSIREAADLIGILTSFSVFDRLHKNGRRSPSAVAEILMRMATGFLAQGSSG